ncbi:MAG TPA: L,D-transpeptidase [Pseudolabrys sp.]|nr:L,D-transpeptidase [Pseudolabrys sp.]
MSRKIATTASLAALIAAAAFATPASAQSLFAFLAPQPQQAAPVPQAVAPAPAAEDDAAMDETLAPRLQRQVVDYPSREAAGTIIVDTPHTYLYLVLGGGKAMRYGIGVGREGFTWSGVHPIVRKTEWPDWYPPAEMIKRQPYLPRMVAGGPGNPLGARAMYIGGTDYRIHGTNDPSSIGKFMSSGCIRLTNADVEDLFSRVKVGAKVIVLPKTPTREAAKPGLSQVASYAPAEQSAPARAWNGLRPSGLY